MLMFALVWYKRVRYRDQLGWMADDGKGHELRSEKHVRGQVRHDGAEWFCCFVLVVRIGGVAWMNVGLTATRLRGSLRLLNIIRT